MVTALGQRVDRPARALVPEPDAGRLLVDVRPAVDLRAGALVAAFLAGAVFLAGARVVAFLAVVFFAAVDVAGRPAVVFFAGVFFAGAFLAAAFFVVVFFAGAFAAVFLAVVFLAVVFLAGAFLAAAFFAAEVLAAVDVPGRPVAVFLVGAFFAAVFFAGDFLACDPAADLVDDLVDAAADVLDAALLLPVAFTVVLVPLALVAALVRVAADDCAAGGSVSATAGFSVRVSFATAGSAGVGTFAGMSASLTGMCVWSLNDHAGHTSMRHAEPALTTASKTPTAAIRSHNRRNAALNSLRPRSDHGNGRPGMRRGPG